MKGEERAASAELSTWRRLLLGVGITCLVCYFVSVFDAVPWAVGRFLFYLFGITLCLSAVAGYRTLCGGGRRPWFELGFLMTAVAGVAVNLMAVVQDVIYTFADRRAAVANDEAAREMVRAVLQGTNDVQLALDIVFDLWISFGVAALAVGLVRYFGYRAYGWLGVTVAVVALGTNLRTLPTPPADAGLFDPGPLVATWLGFFMVLAWRRSGGVLDQHSPGSADPLP